MTRGNWRSSLTWLLVGLIAVALLGGLAYYRPFNPKSPPGEIVESLPLPPKPPGKRTTVLVMGVDKRQDDVGRSDSMMVLSYDEEAQQLSMLSLPRDTWVQIPGHGYDKVNHAYAFGQERLAVSAVSRFLGLPIDHTVTVNFQGFARLVDALGGIEINAEKRMVYQDPYDTGMGPGGLVIDIQPGLQRMDGLTALKYSRFRYDEEGDVGRMRRQQQVVKAIVAAANRPTVVTHIPQLVPALFDTVSTDMSIAEMLGLASNVRDALGRPLRTVTVGGTPTDLGGIFYFIPDIVSVRTAAYQTLVGGYPPESFLTQARDEQGQYAKVLADAVAQDQKAKAAMSVPSKENAQPGKDPKQQAGGPTVPQAGPDVLPPDFAAPGQGQNPGQPQPPGQGPGADQPPAPGGQTASPAKPVITIALLDGSGHNLALVYEERLKAAGFRVSQVTPLPEPVSQTFAVDHTGRTDTADRIHAVLPGVPIHPGQDSQPGDTVMITLGADLLPPKP